MVLQAAIQSERDRTEKLLAEAAERQRELEERTTKMLEEERARNDMQARAMYELLVVFFLHISQNIHVVFVSLLTSMTESSKPNVQSVCEKTGQTAPPMPVIAPGTTVSLI